MPTNSNGESYDVTSRGTNSQASETPNALAILQGNSYDHRVSSNGEHSYHYSNSDGSYYYSNSNGSTYYNNGSGYSRYTSPSGNTSQQYSGGSN